MKGLILKDLITFKKNYKPTGLIGTALLLSFLLMQKNDIGLFIVNFIILPICASAYSSLLSHYDVKWKWERYMLIMPVTLEEIVKSRMISSYIIFLTQAGMLEIFNILFCITHTGMLQKDYIFIITIGFLLAATMVSILSAIDFISMKNQNSSKNSMIGSIIFIFIGVALIIIINDVSIDISFLLSLSKAIIQILMMFVLIIAITGAYVLSVSSYRRVLKSR